MEEMMEQLIFYNKGHLQSPALFKNYQTNPLEHKGYIVKSLAAIIDHGCTTKEVSSYVKLLSDQKLMDDFIQFANHTCGINPSNCTMFNFLNVINKYQESLKPA